MMERRTYSVDRSCLLELINAFIWLDEEHQKRAVKALEQIAEDQVTEAKGSKNTAI